MKKGFTILELLIVIGIIAVLTTIVIITLGNTRNKANVTKVVAQIREINTATNLYITDTGKLPPTCSLNCTAQTDPYLTKPSGVTNWNGPYIRGGVWNLKHPWSGHFSLEVGDVTGDGLPDVYFFLDDDAPGTHYGDNSGIIPEEELIKIDEAIDDGNLATGNARGNGLGFQAAFGEMVILLK